MSNDNDLDNGTMFAPIPVYRRISEDLRARIQEGHWLEGAMLPSRKNLAKEYGVDLRTLQRAVVNLLSDGTLRADERRGTFVARGTAARSNGDTSSRRGLVEERTETHGLPSTQVSMSAERDAHRAGTLGIITLGTSMEEFQLLHRDSWERTIISSMERAFAERGGMTRFFSLSAPNQSRLPLQTAIASLWTEGMEALAIIGIHNIYNQKGFVDEVFAAADTLPIPFVYVTWDDLRAPIPHVFYDQHYAGYQAAHHLIRTGHKRILFLAPFAADWADQRIQGARDAVRRARLPDEAFFLYPSEGRIGEMELHHREAGRVAASALFKDPKVTLGPETGIIVSNDQTAYGVVEVAAARGKKAGQDFGIIGFDDDPESRTLGLTSLRPPLEALGVEAARMVQRALLGEEMSMQVRLRSHLIPRASTRMANRVQP